MNYIATKVNNINEYKKVFELYKSTLNIEFKEISEIDNDKYFIMCIKDYNGHFLMDGFKEHLKDSLGNYYLSGEHKIDKSIDIIIPLEDLNEDIIKQYFESVKFNLI